MKILKEIVIGTVLIFIAILLIIYVGAYIIGLNIEQLLIVVGFVIAIGIGLGGWLISWWLSKENSENTTKLHDESIKHTDKLHKKTKKLTKKIHKETQKLTKRIHRVELIQNRPILVPKIKIEEYNPVLEDDGNIFSKFIGKRLYQYIIKNEGMMAVENWTLETYYFKDHTFYREGEKAIGYSSRESGIRISPNDDVAFYPALLAVNNYGDEINRFYTLKYPRYLRATYKDSTHKKYCSCIVYNHHGMQTEELRHREMEKDAKKGNYDEKKKLCKNCYFLKYKIKDISELVESVKNEDNNERTGDKTLATPVSYNELRHDIDSWY